MKLLGLLLTMVGFCLSASASTTTRHYLSGTDKDNTVEWDFRCSDGMRSGKWDKIAVPSCWELQGFGHYNYGHDPLEERVNESGEYKYKFSIPKEWSGRAVRIVFEGVMTDAQVRINGKLAGEKHQGAFYEFKYDIEKLLKFGAENLLDVTVNKASSNESINHAERKSDFWVFGGIYRPVYLEVMPREHIERVAIDAQASGDLKIDLFTESKLGKGVTVELQSLCGEKIATLKPSKCEKLRDRWSIEAKAEGIKTWNPEHPNLYQLALSIDNASGEALHTITQRIGFRTIEILESDGIYVNGEKIKFKGVNRHSFHPESGRTTSRALSLKHIEMMKDMNMNAVRMSHYPPDVNFLDLCDSIGLFVIDEVCTWHTPKLDTEVGRKIVREMVTRDVNHPSITLWANGNETGWNTELDGDYGVWDIQKRTVIHPWNVFGKLNTLHYPLYNGTISDSRAFDKILFHTEFLHGLYDGGHGAGLEDFWNIHWHSPLAAGGFLWCFTDEMVVRTDKGGILDGDGNHAPDGIVGPYLEKEGSYYTIKEIWSPIYIEDRFIRDDFTGTFNIENRYHYTNLSECSMEAKWLRFSDQETKVMSRSEVKLPSLKPLEKGRFTLDKPANWREADALHLTAYDHHGKEVFTWSYPVKQPAKLNAELINYPQKGKVSVERSEDKIVAKCKSMEYVFDSKDGSITSIKRFGKVIPLSGGPLRIDQKSIIKEQVADIKIQEVGNATEITFVFEPTKQKQEWVTRNTSSSDTIRWCVHTSGLLDLKVVQKGRKRVDGYMGITFNYPEDRVEGMKWLGDGPYRVWRNRMKGTRFQVWENEYNNTITGERGWVYPEFKGFFSSLYWAELQGKDGDFKVYCHTPNIFLRLFTPDKPADFKRGNPTLDSFPAGDISFVMNIPAIGTKFQDPGQTGPHGDNVNYYGNYDEPLIIELTFDFGRAK